MAHLKTNPVRPERASFKTINLSMVNESIEAQLYTLMCIKNYNLLQQFINEWGDCGRKLLVEVKYKLSNCPLTYAMIRDIVQKSSQWNVEKTCSQYVVKDKERGTQFTLYNQSRGIREYSEYDSPGSRQNYSRYDPNRIKLYFNGEYEMFNENESTIMAKVLDTYLDMLTNLKELQRQQKIHKSAEELRGLY